MADIRKEQEREELHKTIWKIADDLRGSVDGWDFKSYVLGMMFYRYISENLTNYINAGEAEALSSLGFAWDLRLITSRAITAALASTTKAVATKGKV